MQVASSIRGRAVACRPVLKATPTLRPAAFLGNGHVSLTAPKAPAPRAPAAAALPEVDMHMLAANPAVADLAEGLETPVQLIYLLTLLGFLGVGAYLVARQVLVRRELEEAAKVLGERVRNNEATCEDHFELGVILLRKKLFTSATKSLERAKKDWDGEPYELAQVHNALGFAYYNVDRAADAVSEYRLAVELQPGYVTAWNNLGDAYEKVDSYEEALSAYEESLSFAPDNKVAEQRADALRRRIARIRI